MSSEAKKNNFKNKFQKNVFCIVFESRWMSVKTEDNPHHRELYFQFLRITYLSVPECVVGIKVLNSNKQRIFSKVTVLHHFFVHS